ncbi:hypothetical protein JCM31447_30440 [Fluviispira sanaruensis]|uniref:Sulfatase N-terminal domain-containing protein n=1 Tax=Fluviispira sanaruensis TaxID=2493639 RepID=A0A4P2VME3_FLUSA|nr:hypothetical protein JCM31447_30440 [Fluviispira sanaruensis]
MKAISNIKKNTLELISVQFLIFFFNLTIIHFFTMNDLGFELVKGNLNRFISLYIMLANDFLISIILILLFLPIIFILNRKKFKIKTFFVVNLLIASFLSMYIIYTDFYKSGMSKLHLKFLLDLNFLSSSFNMIFNFRYLFVVLLNLAFIFLLIKIRQARFMKFSILKLIVISLLSIFLLVSKNLISESSFFKRFSANIATKSVTENFIYLLFEQLSENDKYIRNLDSDYRILYRWRYKKDSTQVQISDDDIYNIIQDEPILTHNKIGAELKNQVQNSLSGKEPLYIWVILLESFKPQNGQWLYPKHEYSFTPYYDKLALSGLSFSNAWTVGGVTRAGQQGSLCGSWTGETSDAFRGTFKYYPVCIPELLNEKFTNSQSYYWYAGDLRFDDTQKFWTTHGIKFMTGLGDFAKDSESTWWGASDKSLFDKVNALVTIEPKVQLHIVMTLTNHPEFTLLHDLTYPDQSLLSKAEVNMQKTTYYTDLSLEIFINNLKNRKLNKKSNTTIWDQSLLIMVNDHGNFIPDLEYPLSDKSKNPDKLANMLTRANLVMHGGLVENVLKKLNLHTFNTDISKSQADIYPTLLDFLNINQIETISDSLFSEQRRWPVYTEGFGKVFVPPLHLNKYKVVQWKREDLLENKNVFIPKEDAEYYLTAKALFRLNEYLKIKGICCKKR